MRRQGGARGRRCAAVAVPVVPVVAVAPLAVQGPRRDQLEARRPQVVTVAALKVLRGTPWRVCIRWKLYAHGGIRRSALSLSR